MFTESIDRNMLCCAVLQSFDKDKRVESVTSYVLVGLSQLHYSCDWSWHYYSFSFI